MAGVRRGHLRDHFCSTSQYDLKIMEKYSSVSSGVYFYSRRAAEKRSAREPISR